jgi:quercetin dioxygenase-like cupin family protein
MGINMFKKLDISFNVENLREFLESCDYWDERPHRRNYEGSPHKEMVDIWARFGDPSDLLNPHEARWYPVANEAPDLIDICLSVFDYVDGSVLGGVLITKLPAGGEIKHHIDTGWHAEEYDKFYIPITRPEGSRFCFESGDILGAPGDCYWFRNDVSHWVLNDGNSDRITLIVCIKTDKFRG